MAHKPGRPHNFRPLSKPKTVPKHHLRTYWPYIPLLLLLGVFSLNIWQPAQRSGVLAYATEMSASSLLSSTNAQREQNGVGDLQLNSELTAAAQAKANDMIARNYWSHNTPDGQEPWVFFDNAGYKFQKAGENLAYGFATSSETVTGWMNSPPHRENLLDTAFVDVGFGFANGNNYNNSGQETVVVAEYGKPQVLAASNSQPSAAAPAPAQANTTPAAEAPAPAPTTSQTPAPTETTPQPVTSDTPIVKEPATKQVARVETLTGGHAPWALFAVGLISGLAAMLILLKHAAGLRHVLRNSERFILHHPLLDTLLVSTVLLGSFLSQTTGFIR
ncbi:MAG TPA: CAP domain-containing protein [Patescibacteria group bacterium]|nr:CAP domain-containing protein [Patescibacteria group bacterium]